jgi:hypothetical protein
MISWHTAIEIEAISEGFMQIYGNKLGNADRPVARRWTFGGIGFYGSIMVLMILYAKLGH